MSYGTDPICSTEITVLAMYVPLTSSVVTGTGEASTVFVGIAAPRTSEPQPTTHNAAANRTANGFTLSSTVAPALTVPSYPSSSAQCPIRRVLYTRRTADLRPSEESSREQYRRRNDHRQSKNHQDGSSTPHVLARPEHPPPGWRQPVPLDEFAVIPAFDLISKDDVRHAATDQHNSETNESHRCPPSRSTASTNSTRVAHSALMEDVKQGVAVIRSVAGLVGCVSRMPCHLLVDFRAKRLSGQIQSRCGS
jgi:hypothetical protein